MTQDVACPKCNSVIAFKNIMMFEPKEVEILGIAYFLECKKCNTTFLPEIRMSKKATNEQLKYIKEQISKAGN
jgi:hypothetical protein